MEHRRDARPLLRLIALAICLCVSLRAYAQQITAQVSSRQCYVGEPLRVTVIVSDAQAFDGPTFDAADGLEIRRLPGEQTSTRMEIVNGRMRQERTVGINFEVIASTVGAFEIPSFAISVDGQTFRTDPIPIKAVVSETGDLMLVRVASTPRSVFVGQQAALELEIAVRSYRDREMGISLDEASMWSLIDRNATSWGAFGPVLQKMLSENRRPRGEARVIGDTEYTVFTLVKPYDPIAAGPVQLGDIRIRMEYPLRLRRSNDFLFENRLQLAESRPILASPASVDVEVRSVPEGGRPAGWNGAVGRFEIAASAMPIEVSVGDPITLTLRATDLSGTSALEGLQAPDLARQPSFATGFRVPRDAAAGSVESRSKVFTQSIRALSDTVTEIPPIEFVYFDPDRGEYEVARSAPIAITVKPSAVARIELDGSDEADGAQKPAFTRVEGGLLANASIAESSSSATVDLGWLLAPFGAGPAALGLALWMRRRADADRQDPSRRRSRGAMKGFEQKLAADGSAEGLAAAVLSYIADRTGAPPGSLTRGDAVASLASRGAPATVCTDVETFLRRCERARYSGERIVPDDARALVRSLERERLAAKAGAA